MKRVYLLFAVLIFSTSTMAQKTDSLTLHYKDKNKVNTLKYKITFNGQNKVRLDKDSSGKSVPIKGPEDSIKKLITSEISRTDSNKFVDQYNITKRSKGKLTVFILPESITTPKDSSAGKLPPSPSDSAKKVVIDEGNNKTNNTENILSSLWFWICIGFLVFATTLYYFFVHKNKDTIKNNENKKTNNNQHKNSTQNDTSTKDDEYTDGTDEKKITKETTSSNPGAQQDMISKDALKKVLNINKNNPSEKEIINEINRIRTAKEAADNELKNKESELKQLDNQKKNADKEKEALRKQKEDAEKEKNILAADLQKLKAENMQLKDSKKNLEEENTKKDEKAAQEKKQHAAFSGQLLDKYYTALLKEIKNEEDEIKIKQTLIAHLVQIALHSKSHFAIQAGQGKGEDDMNTHLMNGVPVSPSKTVSINSAPNEQDSLTRAIILLMKDYGMTKIDGVFINGIKISE